MSDDARAAQGRLRKCVASEGIEGANLINALELARALLEEKP